MALGATCVCRPLAVLLLRVVLSAASLANSVCMSAQTSVSRARLLALPDSPESQATAGRPGELPSALVPASALNDDASGRVARISPTQASPRLTASAPTTTAVALARMAALAGVIFAGQVTAVRRPAGYAGSPQNAAEGLIEVEFRVDEAVRGTTAGSRFVLKEWSGLWAGDIDRYLVGQRLLMFLHAPNAQGMSSPIDGMDGALPLHGNGPAPKPTDTITTPGEWMVDLRWLEAQVLRESAAAPGRGPIEPDTAESESAPNEAGSVSTGDRRELAQSDDSLPPAGKLPRPAGEAVRSSLGPVLWRVVGTMPQPSSSESLQDVLTLCREWERQSDESR